MNRLTHFKLLYLIVFLFLVSCVRQSSPDTNHEANTKHPHPLNPLDEVEIREVKNLLLSVGHIDTTFRFFVINLKEPPKAEVLQYQSGTVFRREAFAVLYDWSTNKTYEAVVDLQAKKVTSFCPF